MNVEIRLETDADRAAVRAIVTAAFGQSGEADLVDQLRAGSEPCLMLVAELDGEVAGHVCFSPVRVGGREFAGLAPVAVAPDVQRRGIGSALIRAGLERCLERGWAAVFLVGDPAYYSRFGFALATPRGFSYGEPYFDRHLQVVELREGALRGLAGRVLFNPAFGQTDAG